MTDVPENLSCLANSSVMKRVVSIAYPICTPRVRLPEKAAKPRHSVTPPTACSPPRPTGVTHSRLSASPLALWCVTNRAVSIAYPICTPRARFPEKPATPGRQPTSAPFPQPTPHKRAQRAPTTPQPRAPTTYLRYSCVQRSQSCERVFATGQNVFARVRTRQARVPTPRSLRILCEMRGGIALGHGFQASVSSSQL
jgi:hypothetical protein